MPLVLATNRSAALLGSRPSERAFRAPRPRTGKVTARRYPDALGSVHPARCGGSGFACCRPRLGVGWTGVQTKAGRKPSAAHAWAVTMFG